MIILRFIRNVLGLILLLAVVVVLVACDTIKGWRKRSKYNLNCIEGEVCSEGKQGNDFEKIPCLPVL